MTKKGSYSRSTGKNRPPRNSLDASWLPIVEDVHRNLPVMRQHFAERRNPNLAHHGPRKKRRPLPGTKRSLENKQAEMRERMSRLT